MYKQLYEELKRKIITSEWVIGSFLPLEKQLMDVYQLSRETVRRALLKRVNESYLDRRRGRGTVVCRRRPEDGLEQTISFSAEMISRGVKPGAKLLDRDERLPPAGMTAMLKHSLTERVLSFKRIRKADNIPVALAEPTGDKFTFR